MRPNTACIIVPLLLLFVAAPTPTNAIIEDVIEVFHLAREVISVITGAWRIVEQTPLKNEIDLPFLKRKEQKILLRITEVSRQIALTESHVMNGAAWTIQSVTDQVRRNTKLELSLHELTDLMNRISAQASIMESYSEHLDHLEHDTILKFADWAVSPNTQATQGMLDRIDLLVHGSPDIRYFGRGGVLDLIAEELEEAKSSICSTKQSAQQVLYNLYNAISITELKGYSMMQFSWMLLKTYGKGNYTKEAELMRNRFEQRTSKTQELLKKVMERADRSVWRCDPVHQVEGETYEQITRLLQGYVENEVDMNTDGTCSENCAHYQYTESYGCYKELYCARQPRCKGKLLHCKYVDSDMWICPAKPDSNRRYEYIEYENGKVLGKLKYCSRGTTKVDSWWRYLFWHCSYCFCMCDEEGRRSDRYFNLRPAVSNATDNRVVTGVRFVKRNRILHLQVQEGKLLPRGNIDPATIQWVPISDYTLLDRNIKKGQDYHALAWDNRAIDLDELIAKPSHVVTGVKFRLIGAHLNLEVRIHEFDFPSGKLDEMFEWISNDNTDGNVEGRRTRVQLNKPDIPTVQSIKHLPDSTNNQFIEFTNTDIDADAAQTTVPFIDIQDVVSEPVVPLSGVGLHHKGRPLSGGLVAPKIFTYDFSLHVLLPKAEDAARVARLN